MLRYFLSILVFCLGSGAHGAQGEEAGSPLLNKYGNPVSGYFVDHNVINDRPRFGFALDESGQVGMYLDYPGLPPVLKRTISLKDGVGRYANEKAKWVMTVKEGRFRSLEVRMEAEQLLDLQIKFKVEPVTFEAIESERWTPRMDSALLSYTSKKFSTKAELLVSMREAMKVACTANERVVEEKATVCEISYPYGEYRTHSETQYFECVIVYQCH